VVTDRDDCKFSSTDWFRRYIGDAVCVLYPKEVGEVGAVLRYCDGEGLCVVPQGGNTGLVGGGTPVGREIILSLRKMNKVINFDGNQGILECEAGCVLQDLMDCVGGWGYEMPFDLPARGSCTIGGNVATAAGGINFVKHGPLRANVLGLEVVLANGKVLDMMSCVRKDSTGPDLKQLFIQSEGTLGLITKVSIQCAPMQKEKKVAILDVESYAHVPETLALCKSILGRS
jgi:FAD/FMN-containing dehydrogenase